MKKFHIGKYQKEQGDTTREAVRACVIRYPGIKNIELARILGVSFMTVGRHVRTIRGEWTPRYLNNRPEDETCDGG